MIVKWQERSLAAQKLALEKKIVTPNIYKAEKYVRPLFIEFFCSLDFYQTH